MTEEKKAADMAAYDADQLAALIDELMSSGTQHVDLTVGETTNVRTVNSTDCGTTGACAIPNFDFSDPDDEEML